ncbi:hypothetical protein BJF78_17700 [Pseudonocardia sp. CNS-139]|nr:hypothetical protein BJF78_17700 [Pseudonocardia sp. CNS-139]
MLCALVARAVGLTDVRLVEVDADRRRFATDLGLDVTDTLDEQVPRVVEASGSAGGIAAALDACADGGSVVLLGLTGAPTTPVDLDRVVVRDLTVLGSLGSPGVWPEVVALVAEGKVRPSVLVSHRFGLTDVAAAYTLAARREAASARFSSCPERGPMSERIVTLASDDVTVTVLPQLGARVHGVTAFGTDLLRTPATRPYTAPTRSSGAASTWPRGATGSRPARSRSAAALSTSRRTSRTAPPSTARPT